VPGVTDAPTRDGWSFRFVDRVRFADLDAMRHLNNVAFLTFFESARVAYLTALLAGYRPEQRDAFGTVVAEVHLNYRSPAYYDEEIHTWLRPANIARSAFRIEVEMRSGRDDRLLAEGYAVLVGFHYGLGKSVPLPDNFRAALDESALPALDDAGPREADPRAI
jgi:acyl-CoA thioester hydrolase